MSGKINPQQKLPTALFQNVLIFAGNLPFAARVSKNWSKIAKNPETERLFYCALGTAYMNTPSLNLYIKRGLFLWKKGDRAYALIDRTIQLIWGQINQIDHGVQPLVRRWQRFDTLASSRLTMLAKQVEQEVCESTCCFFAKLAIQLPAARKRQNTLEGKPLQKAIDIRVWCEKNRELLAKVKTLDLSDIGLTFLPAEICFFANLESLNINKNLLTSLPVELAFLSKLTQLSLRSNMFLSLPKEIGHLSNLEHLIASHNMLSELPKEILFLKKLTQLHLEGNNFVNFPIVVCGLSSLLELNLSMNRIVDLPETVSNLRSLAHLFLNDNRIRYLPSSLAQLKSLEQLDVRTNDQGCFAAPELLASNNQAIQDALLAAELHDTKEPVVSFFTTSLARFLLSFLD